MTHQFPITVYYEDTDMGGVVYHANFLRFIERARSDYVRRLGVDQNAMRNAGIVWVVTRIEADYLSPARFEDELIVETVPEKMTTARLTMSQIVRRGARAVSRQGDRRLYGYAQRQTGASSGRSSRILVTIGGNPPVSLAMALVLR